MATKEYSKSQITVRTKDELANAIKKGYGKIYPDGPEKENLITLGKKAGLQFTGAATAALIAFNITLPAVLVIGAGVALFSSFPKIKFMKYKVDNIDDKICFVLK